MRNTSINVPAIDKADVICLEPVSLADTLPTPGCEANCEGYSSVLDATANSLKDKMNREENCTDSHGQLPEGREDVWSKEVRTNHGLAIHCGICVKIF